MNLSRSTSTRVITARATSRSPSSVATTSNRSSRPSRWSRRAATTASPTGRASRCSSSTRVPTVVFPQVAQHRPVRRYRPPQRAPGVGGWPAQGRLHCPRRPRCRRSRRHGRGPPASPPRARPSCSSSPARARSGAESERGVLRRQVPQWLGLPEFRSLVVGFEEAHIGHGGEGALYVRVRRARL